jgi:hypothetical protein
LSDFDWNKYEDASPQTKGFSWDKYQDVTPESEKPGKLESLARGLAQGATMNHADELAGALESSKAERGIRNANPMLELPGDDMEPEKTYTQARDESRAAFKKASDANPITYGAGDIVGTLATSMIPLGEAGQAAKAASKLTNFEKALAYLKGIGKLSGSGAAIGGLGASGASEANNLNDYAKDVGTGAATGAAVGAATGAATPLIEAGAQKAGSALKNFAEERAFKAAGGITKDAKKLGKKGADKVNQIGRELLDEGIVSPLSTIDEIGERLDQKIADKSGSLNEAIDRADQVAPGSASFDPQDVASRLKDELRAKYPGVPEAKLQPAFDEVDSWLSKQPNNMTARQLQDAKVSMNRFLKESDFLRNPNTGIAREGMTSVRRALKEGIENKGNAAAQVLGDETGEIAASNKSLGNLLEAQNANADASAREVGNRFFGLSDHLVGHLAGGTLGAGEGYREGGWGGAMLGGLAGMAGNKLARKYGSSLMATGADKAAKFLLQSPRFQEMAASNPGAFRALVNNFAERAPMPAAAGNKSSSPEFVSRPVHEDEAKQSFLDGN